MKRPTLSELGYLYAVKQMLDFILTIEKDIPKLNEKYETDCKPIVLDVIDKIAKKAYKMSHKVMEKYEQQPKAKQSQKGKDK